MVPVEPAVVLTRNELAGNTGSIAVVSRTALPAAEATVRGSCKRQAWIRQNRKQDSYSQFHFDLPTHSFKERVASQVGAGENALGVALIYREFGDVSSGNSA